MRIREGNREETIHTENSHKFTIKDIRTIAKLGNLNIENVFTDNNQWISLVHYKKVGIIQSILR